jgi:hypothetical protein
MLLSVELDLDQSSATETDSMLRPCFRVDSADLDSRVYIERVREVEHDHCAAK